MCAGAWTLVVATSGCGGTTPSADNPAPREVSEQAEDATESPVRGADPTPVAPPKACNDETCSSCGDALCPAGFYCEEARSLCSWVPECAGDASCACLQKTLPGCSCDDREGKLYVTCQ
jgi:hypothetical protein